MRKISLTAFLAAFLVAAVALAANEKVVVSFVAQASSGVSGDVTLTSNPNGTMIHGRLSGLEPNIDYVSQSFTDGACSASPATQLATFKSNPMGKAVFTARTTQGISDLKSISVQTKSDLSVKACAAVNP
jgi:hypothetical protein